jgi:hypothetical protein
MGASRLLFDDKQDTASMRPPVCTTKSPLRLAQIAYRLGREVLPAFRSKYCRQDFSEPQYFALLVLRAFLKTDYRGTIELLTEMPRVQRALGLKRLPHYSNLCRAQRRLVEFDALLSRTVGIAKKRGFIVKPLYVAIDSTGLETRAVSPYFFRKTARGDTSKMPYPKLNSVVDVRTHLSLSAVANMGPSQDSPAFTPLMHKAAQVARILRVLGDKGYDAEKNHELCRLTLRIPQTVIPPPRHTGPPKGSRRWPVTKYRRMMKKRFWRRAYGQRWQAESAFSQTKRLLSPQLRGRTHRSQRTETLLKPIVLNLMLLYAPSLHNFGGPRARAPRQQ